MDKSEIIVKLKIGDKVSVSLNNEMNKPLEKTETEEKDGASMVKEYKIIFMRLIILMVIAIALVLVLILNTLFK